MAMIRTLLAGIGLALVVAAVGFPGPLSAKPKHTTAVQIPAGSTVQKMSNGRLNIRNGANIGGTYSCSCSASGSCSTVQTEGTLECGKSGDSCTGACEMTTTTGGGKIMMKR